MANPVMNGGEIQRLAPGYGQRWLTGRVQGREQIHVRIGDDIYSPPLCGVTGTDGSMACDPWEVSDEFDYKMCAKCIRLLKAAQ